MASHPDHPHLPEGREPGYQTLHVPFEARRKSGILAMVAIGVMLIGAGVYFTAAPPNPAKEQPAILALAFFGGIGLAVIAWAAFLHHRGKVKPAHFTIEVDDAQLRRGDTSRAVITCDDPALVRGPVQVGEACREFFAFEAEQDVQPGEIGQGEITVTHKLEAQAAGSWQPLGVADVPVTVEFTVPADGPFSYEGHHVSLAWNVMVTEGDGPNPRFAYGPFWVLP